MKKTYITPLSSICLMETETPISTSMIKSDTGGGTQLVKGSEDWDIWSEPVEEESNSPFE